MPNPNPTALDVVYGRQSSGGCQHFTWVVTVDDPVLGLTVGQRLRESVVAGVGVFWRVIDPTITTNLPSHPDITKIDLLTGGGGGGGPVTVNTTDTEYLRWEVTEPDATLGLVKGDYVIQSVVNNISTWRKFGSATALASAPDTAKLRPESDGGTMIEYRVTTAHGTAPSAFTVGEILWRFVSDDGSVIWRREGVKAPIETPPIMSNLERVVTGGGSSAGTMLEWRVTTAHGTAPDNFAADQVLREFIAGNNTRTWYRQDSTTAIATPPVRANLELIGASPSSGAAGVIDWRVEIAHAGLTVGMRLREYPQPDGTSQWRRLDTGALLTTPPNRNNLSDNFDAIVNAIDTSGIAESTNLLTIAALLGRMVPSDTLPAKGIARNQVVSLTIPKPAVTGQRNVITRIWAGYSGGTMPVDGANLKVNLGDGTKHFATLTEPSPLILMQSDNGVRALNVAAATGTTGEVVFTLDAVPGCFGEIVVDYRVEGAATAPIVRTAADVYVDFARLILSPHIIYYPGYTGPLWDARRVSDSVIEVVSAGEDLSTFAGTSDVTVAQYYDQSPLARHHTPYGNEPLAYIAGVKQQWNPTSEFFDWDGTRGMLNNTSIPGTAFTVYAVMNQARNTTYHQVMDGIAKRSGGMLDWILDSFHPTPTHPVSFKIDGVPGGLMTDPFPAAFLTNTPHILSYVLASPDFTQGTMMGTYTGINGGMGGAGGNERQGTTIVFEGVLSPADDLLVLQDIAAKEGITL